MAGKLLMGERRNTVSHERIRGKMMEMVKQKKMMLKAASLALKVNCRQGKRIYAAYRAGGDGALIHGNAGKKSNNRIDEAGAKCCLITLIDDAANTRMAQFFEEETIFEAMSVLSLWIKTYAILKTYLPKINAKFPHPAANKEDATCRSATSI